MLMLRRSLKLLAQKVYADKSIEVGRHRQQGWEYYLKGEFDSAEASYLTAVDLDSIQCRTLWNQSRRLTRRVLVRLRLSRNGSIKQDTDRSSELNLLIGHLYHHWERYPQALDKYTQACELAPDPAYCHFCLGKLYLKQNQYQEAIDEFQLALNPKPSAAGNGAAKPMSNELR